MKIAKCGVRRKRHGDNITNAANVHQHLVRSFFGQPAPELTNHRSPVLSLYLRLSTPRWVCVYARKKGTTPNSPAFKSERKDIEDIFGSIEVPQLNPPKLRTRGGKQMTFTTAQKDLNNLLDDEFKRKGWNCQPLVTQDKVTGIRADYKKARVQVEVQFGNMARWYTDVFKFQVSYSLGLIDVGVLVVPMQEFADTIDENVAYYERVTRELPYAKMSITYSC